MRIATQPEIPIVVDDIIPNRSTVNSGSRKNQTTNASRSALWLLPTAVVLTVVTFIVACPVTPNAVAGLSVQRLVSIEAIVFLSGVMSGLSGFGFSAIGAASLLILPPILQVPLFQALSAGNQLLSAEQLRKDMPRSFKELWKSERYGEVMNYITSDKFDTRHDCGTLCLQHKVNELLWEIKQGGLKLPDDPGEPPMHVNFI